MIEGTWRLTAARRPPTNTPSEWTGWHVVNPDADRLRYHDRAANGLCTRCGKQPPRPERKTCQQCAQAAQERSAALRARRIAAGRCVTCNRPAGRQTRCRKCRRSYRAGGNARGIRRMCFENRSTLRKKSLELNLESLCCVHADFGPPTQVSARSVTSACEAAFTGRLSLSRIRPSAGTPSSSSYRTTAYGTHAGRDRLRPSLALRDVLHEASRREGARLRWSGCAGGVRLYCLPAAPAQRRARVSTPVQLPPTQLISTPARCIR
jgi:hypothetical protein